MDDRLRDAIRDALNTMFADPERLNRIIDDVLAEQRTRPHREDIRTILARIEALLIEHLEIVKSLLEKKPE